MLNFILGRTTIEFGSEGWCSVMLYLVAIQKSTFSHQVPYNVDCCTFFEANDIVGDTDIEVWGVCEVVSPVTHIATARWHGRWWDGRGGASCTPF